MSKLYDQCPSRTLLSCRHLKLIYVFLFLFPRKDAFLKKEITSAQKAPHGQANNMKAKTSWSCYPITERATEEPSSGATTTVQGEHQKIRYWETASGCLNHVFHLWARIVKKTIIEYIRQIKLQVPAKNDEVMNPVQIPRSEVEASISRGGNRQVTFW
jgi:hypothetical protein